MQARGTVCGKAGDWKIRRHTPLYTIGSTVDVGAMAMDDAGRMCVSVRLRFLDVGPSTEISRSFLSRIITAIKSARIHFTNLNMSQCIE